MTRTLERVPQPSRPQRLLHALGRDAYICAPPHRVPVSIHSHHTAFVPHQPDQVRLRPHHATADAGALRLALRPLQLLKWVGSISDPPSSTAGASGSALPTGGSGCSATHAWAAARIALVLASPMPGSPCRAGSPPATTRAGECSPAATRRST